MNPKPTPNLPPPSFPIEPNIRYTPDTPKVPAEPSKQQPGS
jgi:hypothetical protein